jgi:hypothetical protein
MAAWRPATTLRTLRRRETISDSSQLTVTGQLQKDTPPIAFSGVIPGWVRRSSPDSRGKQGLKSKGLAADQKDMDLSAIALQGLQQASTQLEQAATRIASFGASSADGASLDTVDLSAEMVAMLAPQEQASVNLQTLKTAGEVTHSMIDVMA